jgi:membrane associated rhomboid family serine protease
MRGKLSATIVLTAATALVSALILLTGNLDRAAVALGFIPARLGGAQLLEPAIPAWLTPLTATLVHGGFLHLVMNMLLLAWCGQQVERIIGPGPLALLYLVGAFAAAGAQYLVDPASPSPMIGASGGVSALIGAFAISFSRPKPIVRSFRLNRAINVVWLLVAWVVLQWMMGWLMGLQGVLVATAAHVGGFVAGVALQKPLLLWRYRKA